MTTAVICKKGGAGSGFHGHAGRPGLVGGSQVENGNADFSPLEAPEVPSLNLNVEMSNDIGEARRSLQDYDETYTDPSMLTEFNTMIGEEYTSHYAIDGQNFKFATDNVREYWKSDVIDNISRQSGIDRNTVTKIVVQWAMSSNDEDMRSMSLQESVAEEFGVSLSEWQKTNIEKFRQGKKWFDEATAFEANFKKQHGVMKWQYGDEESMKLRLQMKDAWQESNAGKGYPDFEFATVAPGRYGDVERSRPIANRSTERKVLRSMYDATQNHFKSMRYNPDDTVTIYRGVKAPVAGHSAGTHPNYIGNALESWTISPRMAYSFNGTFIAAKVRIKDIFSFPLTGLGCLAEGEVVIFGNIPGSVVKVINTYD
jgi:hypothetical protein